MSKKRTRATSEKETQENFDSAKAKEIKSQNEMFSSYGVMTRRRSRSSQTLTESCGESDYTDGDELPSCSKTVSKKVTEPMTLKPKPGAAQAKPTAKPRQAATKSRKRKKAADNGQRDLNKDTHPYKSIAHRLLNCLHCCMRWFLCERFISEVDREIFREWNSFKEQLQGKLSGFKKRPYNRLRWFEVRKKLGKPRRFSRKFIDTEHQKWTRKRTITRSLQTKSTASLKESELKTVLPSNIPKILPEGTFVCAILFKPFLICHFGTVKSYNRKTFKYNVLINSTLWPNIGEVTVADCELFAWEEDHKVLKIQAPITRLNVDNETYFEAKIEDRMSINGYAVNDLKNIVHLKKLMEAYTFRVKLLESMNNQAKELLKENDDEQNTNERLECRQINRFKIDYIRLLLGINKYNGYLIPCISKTHDFRNRLQESIVTTAKNSCAADLYRVCRSAANALVERKDNRKVKSLKIREIIRDALICLRLLQMHAVNKNAWVVLEAHLEDFKTKLREPALKFLESELEGSLKRTMRLLMNKENKMNVFAREEF